MAIATIYVTLILEDLKTFAQVPTHIKPEVKRQLEALGYGHLAE